MTLNIILAVLFFTLVSFVAIKRKGWKTVLIMWGILFGILVVVSGAIGFLF